MNNIETDTTKIIDSGSIISFSGESILINFVAEDPNQLKLLFIFQEDEKDKNTRLDSGLNETRDTLELKAINFNSPLDVGNILPILIGNTDQGKELYLSYRIRRIGDSRTLTYTIYLKK